MARERGSKFVRQYYAAALCFRHTALLAHLELLIYNMYQKQKPDHSEQAVHCT